MAKFESIWGELQVGSVTKVEPAAKPEDSKTKPEEAVVNPKPDGEEEEIPEGETGKTQEELEAEAKVKADAEAEEAAKEKVVFEEDDVSKAYEMLEDEGVLDLNEEDEFENTPEGLADAVAATVRNKLEAEIAAIPPVVQDFYAHIMEGSDPSSFKINAPIVWADVDSTDEEVQKAAMLQFYKGQNMTDEDAEEELADVIEAGKLDKKSGIAIATLTTQQEKQSEAQAKQVAKKEKEAADKHKADVDAINATIDATDEMAGFKLDDKRKAAFKQYLFKVNPRTGMTQMQSNMKEEDRKLKIAFMDFVEFNSADFKKEAVTTLSKKRKKKLSRYSEKSVSNANSSASVKTKVDANKGKIKFPTIFGNQTIEVED